MHVIQHPPGAAGTTRASRGGDQLSRARKVKLSALKLNGPPATPTALEAGGKESESNELSHLIFQSILDGDALGHFLSENYPWLLQIFASGTSFRPDGFVVFSTFFERCSGTLAHVGKPALGTWLYCVLRSLTEGKLKDGDPYSSESTGQAQDYVVCLDHHLNNTPEHLRDKLHPRRFHVLLHNSTQFRATVWLGNTLECCVDGRFDENGSHEFIKRFLQGPGEGVSPYPLAVVPFVHRLECLVKEALSSAEYTTVPGYGVLGVGSTGIVLRVKHCSDRGEFAAKIVDKRLDSRIVNEVYVLNKLKNASGVPTLIKCWEKNCVTVVVTQPIGRSLHEICMKSKGCSKTQIVTVVNVLRSLHELGYAHGDCRSVNVIFVSNAAYMIDYSHSHVYELGSDLWHDRCCDDFGRLFASLLGRAHCNDLQMSWKSLLEGCVHLVEAIVSRNDASGGFESMVESFMNLQTQTFGAE